MSAVARMRLGSLTRKHHLRVLRELNDALEDHERLRERLNEHSHPVFQKLVEDIRATMEKRDLERATDLIKAAEQVQRLCADDKLSLELDAHHAHLAFLMRDFETSADYRRRVFIRQLAGSIEFSELRLLEAQYFVMALLGTGHAREALRVARATLDLATEPRGRYYACMQTTVGVLELDLGDLHAAMADIHAGMPYAAQLLNEQYSGYLAKMQLCSGLQTVQDVIATGKMTHSKAAQILRFAACMEDQATLKYALEHCTTDKPGAHPGRLAVSEATFASTLAEAFSRRKGGEAAVLKRLDAAPHRDPRDRAAVAIARCQALRVMGKRKKAEKALAGATELLAAVKPEIIVHIEPMAIHSRNRIELGDEGGREFFDSHYARGFACFRPWIS